MKKLFLFIIVYLFTTSIFCRADTFSIGKNQIKFSPLRVADLVNPGIELSFERLFHKQYATQLSAGYMFDVFGTTSFYSMHGYRLAAEEKHFFRLRRHHKTYLSAEAVYYHVHLGTIYTDGSGDSISVHKQTATINLKYGWETYFTKHLMLDIDFGVGLKYYKVRLADQKLSAVDDLVISPFPDLDGTASQPGHHFALNIPFNIKIGYSF